MGRMTWVEARTVADYHNEQFPPQGIIWPQTSGVLRLCNPAPINTVVVAHLDIGSDPQMDEVLSC